MPDYHLTAVSSIPFIHIFLNHNNPNWPLYDSWNLNNVEKILWDIHISYKLNWYLNTLEWYLPFAQDMTLVSHVQLVIYWLKISIKTAP